MAGGACCSTADKDGSFRTLHLIAILCVKVVPTFFEASIAMEVRAYTCSKAIQYRDSRKEGSCAPLYFTLAS